MKKLIEKIRRWMIRKLGGYTERVSLPAPKVLNLKPVPLRVERIMSFDEFYSVEGALTIAQQNMIERLAEGIQDEGIIQWQNTEDRAANGLRFRATLWVVPAAEMERWTLWDN